MEDLSQRRDGSCSIAAEVEAERVRGWASVEEFVVLQRAEELQTCEVSYLTQLVSLQVAEEGEVLD